jgi:hypothetical protein
LQEPCLRMRALVRTQPSAKNVGRFNLSGGLSPLSTLRALRRGEQVSRGPWPVMLESAAAAHPPRHSKDGTVNLSR